MNEIGVAYRALNLAQKTERDIEAHEDICAIRYGNINQSIDEIKAILKWAGSTAFLLIMGVLGWSVVQQFNANESRAQADAAKIEVLRGQVAEARGEPQYR